MITKKIKKQIKNKLQVILNKKNKSKQNQKDQFIVKLNL